jgi:hypothetical protein
VTGSGATRPTLRGTRRLARLECYGDEHRVATLIAVPHEPDRTPMVSAE